MNPEQQRKYNTIFGGLFLGLGIITWLLAVFFAVVPNAEAPTPVTGNTSIDLQSCRTALGQLGYSANVAANKSDVTAYEPFGSDPKAQLEKATVGVLVCKLSLQSFCMGEGCERPGISFTLRKPVEAKRTVEPVTDNSTAPAAKLAASKATKASK